MWATQTVAWGSIFVASDDQIMRQRDVLLAQAMSAAPRSGTQQGMPVDARGSQRSSRASVAALQSQLAQLTQARSERAAPPAQANVVNGEQYLVFSLLEREFAFKAEHIQGVERLLDVTPVPNVVSWLRGVINLRGSIASVVDLRAFLAMEPLPYNPRTRLLSVHYNEMIICLVVDGVSEMVPIAPSSIALVSTRQSNIPPWAVPYAAGFALLDQQRSIVLLDAARLLFSDKMQHYEALA
jgi:purine-binding chemotaxis protein CheW